MLGTLQLREETVRILATDKRVESASFFKDAPEKKGIRRGDHRRNGRPTTGETCWLGCGPERGPPDEITKAGRAA